MTDASPIRLEVDYTSVHSRWSVLVRVVLALPAYAVLAVFVGPWSYWPETGIDIVWLVIGAGWTPGFLGALMLFLRAP